MNMNFCPYSPFVFWPEKRKKEKEEVRRGEERREKEREREREKERERELNQFIQRKKATTN